MPEHIIYYKSDKDKILNHIIAHECGHIIRIFQAEPSKRVVPFSSSNNFVLASKEMENDIKKISRLIPKSKFDSLLKMLFDGLITQITNLPVDIKIEEWIYNEYPGLREYQRMSLKKQVEEALSGLSPNIKSITPSKIYIASHTMNYAFFNALSRKLNYPFEYEKNEFKIKGDKLIDISEKYENNFEGDITKINEWAEVLNISNWFGWMDFEKIPENYDKMI